MPDRWTVPKGDFRRWLAARLHNSVQHMSMCHHAAAFYPTLFVAYEKLLDAGSQAATVERVLAFLGMPEGEGRALVDSLRRGAQTSAFTKTTSDDLNVLNNLEELMAIARQLYGDQAEALFGLESAIDHKLGE